MLSRCVLFVALVTVTTAAEISIIRPCHVNHHDCIRANLAANSRCNPVPRAVPAQYTIPRFGFEAPFFNASYIDINLLTKNHNNCFFSEFYDNIRTGRTILSMDCPGLALESNRLLIQHRSFVEDETYSFHVTATYPLIRLTTIFDKADGFDLCKAATFADLAGGMPNFMIIANDARTENFLSKDLSLMPIYEREQLYGRRHWLARFFINRVLCDFGCDN